MFWDKSYTPHNIDALLAKADVSVEEFLEEDDIIQECKTQKKVLLNYFTRTDVIRRLVELITTEPPENLPLNQRFRHANVACEILTLGLPSLDEKLLTDEKALTLLYSYLQNEPPLNSLLASFFSKTFRTLFTKKSDQDWFLYQQMCLKLLEYLKLQNNFVDLICKHFVAPVIPDLILQMMDSAEGGQLKRSLYEWLNAEQLVEKLIDILHNKEESEKYTNVSEFFCDLIEHGRLMRQNEHENDAVESTFGGSNPILKNIESTPTLEALLNVILQPNAPESAIISGIMIVLKIIKPVILDEPNSDRLKLLQDREMEIQKDLLTTVIRVIAPHLKYFNDLLINPPHKADIVISAATLSPPLGNIRLQICRFFTVLLQTRNEEITKVICETSFFETLLSLFKQYCWNNFLHSEVEKCIQIIFCNSLNKNINNTKHTIIGSSINTSNMNVNSIFHNIGDNVFKDNITTMTMTTNASMISPIQKTQIETHIEDQKTTEVPLNKNEESSIVPEQNSKDIDGGVAVAAVDGVQNIPNIQNVESVDCNEEQHIQTTKKTNDEFVANNVFSIQNGEIVADSKGTPQVVAGKKDNDGCFGPSMLQTHVIVNCKIISKLLECWQYNKEMQFHEKGRRLGYMGYLLKIFNHIKYCISESEHIGALIEKNLCNEKERELWETIIKRQDGEFAVAMKIQGEQLANCNPHEFCDEACVVDNFMDNVLHLSDSSEILEDDEEDDDDNAANNEGNFIYDRRLLNNIINNTWDSNDMPKYNNGGSWLSDFSSNDFADFADFDAHFSSFHNSLSNDYIISPMCQLPPTTTVSSSKPLQLDARIVEAANRSLSALLEIPVLDEVDKVNDAGFVRPEEITREVSQTVVSATDSNTSFTTDQNNGFVNSTTPDTMEEYNNNTNVDHSPWISPFCLNSGGEITLAKYVNECENGEFLWPKLNNDNDDKHDGDGAAERRNRILETIVNVNAQARLNLPTTTMQTTKMVTDENEVEEVDVCGVMVTNGPTQHTKSINEINNDDRNNDNDEAAVSNGPTPLELNINCTKSTDYIGSNDEEVESNNCYEHHVLNEDGNLNNELVGLEMKLTSININSEAPITSARTTAALAANNSQSSDSSSS